MLDKLFGSGISEVIKTVGDVVDDLITTDQEKLELDIKRREQDIREYEISVDNTKSARDRETKINESENASWLTKNAGAILAVGTIVLTFTLFYQILYMDIQDSRKDIIIYILGALTSQSMSIYNYFFGSSSGSKDKDNQIAKLIK